MALATLRVMIIAAIQETTTDYETSATVIMTIPGTMGCDYKRFSGRGCVARAAKYIRANGYEMVDLWMLRQMETETWNAAVK